MSIDSSSLSNQQRHFHLAALSTLRNKLTSYGNQISVDHDLALSGLCELASMILFEDLDKRVYFSLPCGMGKTTAVRAILQTIHEQGLPFRIVVASSKVEELCSLKRTLIDFDTIPDEKIGLQHSYPCSPERAARGEAGYASEPSGNTEAQFLLVTHANVQSGADRSWMNRCDLVLFDESLVVGEAQCLALHRDSESAAQSVFSELATLEGYAGGREPHLLPAATAARVLYDQLLATAGQLDRSPVGIVRADCIDAAGIRKARMSMPSQPDQFPLIRQLFDWAERAAELRVFGSDVDRTTLITYSVSVPDRLRGLIVLDASGPIREIVHYDKRMERAEDVVPSLARFGSMPGGLASIKYHSDVEVSFACVGGGRSTLTSALQADPSPWVLEKLRRLVESKPGESFLVVTYKAKAQGAGDFSKRILQTLVDAGVDPDERVLTGIPDTPEVSRIAVTTWGRETGTNAFSAYQNVVLLGVFRKPEESVAGTYLGQVDDLRCPRMKTVVRRLVESECWHAIYQAMNRCRMRRVQVVDGVTQALPCSVYIWHRDSELEARLRAVLPDCPSWEPWAEPEENAKEVDVVMRIRAELGELESAGVHSISCKALRRRLGPVSASTFLRARRKALEGSRWVMTRATITLLNFDLAA